ncbi:hypothetical protein C8J56DRAFT_1027267 [Mycena floridula]|nr:hypothetical protein C8J56DRAFT_1027267 [Mycena floridula]
MDPQLGTAPPKESNPTIFSSYVREAKIYDSGMVARWKVLMDGLLLFAALFSAVVTAFIIESYKNLSPDLTVVFLYQISQQLSTMTNSTELNLLSLSDFSGSPKLAIITNVFWFLSLALSLTCALTATLIQQWASDYVRAIERREAPEIRARIRAYLFEGVENSNVAVIVEGTPLLLHASLFSFFIGLVFFLHPINTIMTFLTANILAAFGIAYLSATIAPLIDTASPFRTPLTTLILQFSLARNSIRKTSLCGLRMASFMGSRAETMVKSCWKAVRKHASSVSEIGQTTTERLSELSAWSLSRILWSRKEHGDTIEMQPSSEIPEELPEGVISAPMKLIRSCLESLQDIWWDDTLSYSSDLDAIKENTALDRYITGFQEREIKALSWTLEHTTTDAELLLILEAIPFYLESGNSWLDCHFEEDSDSINDQSDPSTEDSAARVSVLQAVLGDPETGFPAKLDTFISTRKGSATERDATAVVNALSFLFEKGVHPYTSATKFIPRKNTQLYQFLDQVAQDYPTLAGAARRLPIMEIFQCSKARCSAEPVLTPIPFLSNTFNHIFFPPTHGDKEHNFWRKMIPLLEILGIECEISGSSVSWIQRWDDSTDLEKHRGTVLFAVCSFFHKEAGHFPGHFATESFSLAMEELARFISPLCEGSTEAQGAYSAAVWFITSSLEQAGTEAEEARHWREIHHLRQFLWLLLDPLLQVTDEFAVKRAEKVFSHPFLWNWGPFFGFNSETLSGNSVLRRIICAHQLANSFRTPIYVNGSQQRLPPSIPENLTFSNIDSTIQSHLVEDLENWLRKGLPELSSEDTKVVPELFQLLATQRCSAHFVNSSLDHLLPTST